MKYFRKNHGLRKSRPLYTGTLLMFFFLFLFSYQGKSQQPVNAKIASVTKSADALNQWPHNGWGEASSRYHLRFQEEKAILVYEKHPLSKSTYSDHSEADRNYSESYRERVDGMLEKPKYPEFIMSGFKIPVTEIDYSMLMYSAKKVIPSEEDNQQDWPYPIAPVIKVGMYSLGQKKSFAVIKKYRSQSGLYDSTVIQQVNKITYYYPLSIRYHRELDGNPDKHYIEEAKKMFKELFANLELYSKSSLTPSNTITK